MSAIRKIVATTILVWFSGTTALANTSDPAPAMSAIFSPENETQKVLDIEAALASAQADLGIIPRWAASELKAKASTQYVSQEDLAAEYSVVRHRMVALLNVWQRSLKPEAAEYMHFGATTVDIYDTALALQLAESSQALIIQLRALEEIMMRLAREHKGTVMVGRTLGQHALPITFGKKVSTWLGENRRNIERLKEVRGRILRSAILKGAVGSYVGLGDDGIEVERAFAMHLGLQTPYPDDWHGARDVFAEYAYTLGLISKSYGRIGNELFLMQMTDIGETEEVRSRTAVGSSTMPHKKNPSKSEALIFYSRSIPRTAEIIADDMINVFERDNTSRTNRLFADISIEAEDMLKDAAGLLGNLKVNAAAMSDNLEKTRGMILSQRVTFALADKIGKTTANSRIHELAVEAMAEGISLREAVERSPDLAQYFSDHELSTLFDSSTYIGLAREQVEAVIAYCQKARKHDLRVN